MCPAPVPSQATVRGAGAEDQVPRPELDHDAPLALRPRSPRCPRSRTSPRAALRPGRAPFGGAGDRQGHRRAEDLARRSGPGRLAEHRARCRRLGSLLDDVGLEASVEPRDRVVDRDPANVRDRRAGRAARDHDADRAGTPAPRRLRRTSLEITRPSGTSHDSSAHGRSRRSRSAGARPRRRRGSRPRRRERPRARVPRLTRRTTSRSARSTRAPAAGVWAITRPAGTDSE